MSIGFFFSTGLCNQSILICVDVALCHRFLSNPSRDIDLRRWAVEGLAYLTLDAEVKEELITDPDSLSGLMDIAKVCVGWRCV